MYPNATTIRPDRSRRRIFLMRHGEVDYFTREGAALRPETVPINEEGREQARAAGEALAGLALDLALTSGLERAAQTALLALGGRVLPIEHDPRFREIETGRLAEWSGGDPDR